jgi:hypothetical protein
MIFSYGELNYSKVSIYARVDGNPSGYYDRWRHSFGETTGMINMDIDAVEN